VEVYRRDSDTSAVQDDQVRAPMPGRVVVVRAARGDSVVAGQELVIVEAMKMELALKAPRDGVVASVSAAEGDFVEADTVLVSLEH
jgi:3-methylcrotonyl-CoA carboxylase alpha subunit